MKYLLAFTILVVCFAAMAIGYILTRKTLKRGCAESPEDCACLRENKDPASCSNPKS